GEIRGKKLDGEVHASSTNGRVDLQMVSVSQDIEAETTNGTIALQVPPDSNADVSARVTNGRIGIEDLPSLKADDENSRRRFSGRLGSGGHAIRLSTTNGGISITGRRGGAMDDSPKMKQPKEPVER